MLRGEPLWKVHFHAFLGFFYCEKLIAIQLKLDIILAISEATFEHFFEKFNELKFPQMWVKAILRKTRLNKNEKSPFSLLIERIEGTVIRFL